MVCMVRTVFTISITVTLVHFASGENIGLLLLKLILGHDENVA